MEESAIRDGMAHLKDDSAYDNLYDAGLSRAEADWLVGMNGSQLFTCRYGSKLTIGRVQMPMLAMLVEWDNAVANFQKQKYFTVELDTGFFHASSKRFDSETEAEQIAAACHEKVAEVTNVEKQVKTQNLPKLFDLTNLQREANKLFGYTAQQTLDYQQSLYEKKLSTYPQMDSQYITADILESIEHLAQKLRAEFSNFDFVKKAKNLNFSQCVNDKKVISHPAILPTEKVTSETLEQLPEGEKNILLLEMARLFCAASAPHKYESVKITLVCKQNEFTATGKTILTDGWKKIDALFTSAKAKSKEKESEEKALPDVQKGQVYGNVMAQKSEHFTSQPKPYTESALLSAMEHAGQENYDENSEKKGLGTPATRAATIEGLVKNGYAERKGKQILSTEKGRHLISAVPEEVRSPKLTADWEMQLQQIAEGNYSKNAFLYDIESFVRQICETYGKRVNSISFGGAGASIGKCPKCGSTVKKGKFGFYCTEKCGMNIAKVYGKELTESQLKNLLFGKQVSYTSNGRKTTVLPSFEENTHNGKTYYQWETLKKDKK